MFKILSYSTPSVFKSNVREIGEISSYRPSNLRLLNNPDGSKALVITSFDMLGRTNVQCIPNMGLFNPALQGAPPSLNRSLVWPNSVTPLPDGMFGRQGVLVAGGFLVPFAATGAVSFLDLATGQSQAITQKKPGWFYHQATLVDFNRTGRPDVLTARAHQKGMSFEGELVLLRRPERPGDAWTEQVLAKGPDVHFEVADINHDGKPEIITAGFWSEKLSVFYEQNGRLQERVIDNSIGKVFDVCVADLNGDGRPELLVTNHARKGAVFAYEVPNDLARGQFQRHVLSPEIKTKLKGPFQAAPGNPLCFYPDARNPKGKPWIAVSGDAAGQVLLLKPRSQDPRNFDYQTDVILESECTVGHITAGDMNQDGRTEILVPLWEKNKVVILQP